MLRRLLLLWAILGAPSNPQLAVMPRVMMRGAAARVTCRVARDPANRRVIWGFSDYLADERQLDGDASRVTWEALFEHLPCDPGDAFCRVIRADGSRRETRLAVEVAACH